jgi:hypothetical protein
VEQAIVLYCQKLNEEVLKQWQNNI